jgi:hypothetical protein
VTLCCVDDARTWIQSEEPETLLNGCGTHRPIERVRLRHGGANAGWTNHKNRRLGYREKRRRSVRCFAYPYGHGNLDAYEVVPVVVISFNSSSASPREYIFSSIMPSGWFELQYPVETWTNWRSLMNDEAILASSSADMQLLSIACRTDRVNEVFAA